MRHFHWAVTSTEESRGAVKLAKFKAFLSHVINKHKDLPSKIFNKCAHGVITKKHMWLTKGIYIRLMWVGLITCKCSCCLSSTYILIYRFRCL